MAEVKKQKVVKPAVKTSKGVKAGTVGGAHKDIKAKGERGFILSSGKFADREEAAKVAKRSGQTARPKRKGKLHSSDLPERKTK